MRILKIKFHQVDKIKSLEEQLVEFKTKVENLTSAKLVVEPNSKEKDFFIPPFKRNKEELKANIVRIDKGKNSDVNTKVSKPMFETPHRMKEKYEFIPICYHCGVSGHTCPNCFKLFPYNRVSNRSYPLSKGPVPILGGLLKALSFLTQFQENLNSSMSFSRHTRIRAFSSSRPKTHDVQVIKEPNT